MMHDHESFKNSHISSIDTTIDELRSLQSRTIAPANIQHQYIGTIIDNTICLLIAPRNSLSDATDKKFIIFDKYENWVSVMQAVHRSFYSSIHSAIEIALAHYCKEMSITVISTMKKKYETEYNEIKKKLSTDIEPLVTKFFIKINKKNNPSFYDYLDRALKNSNITKENQKVWRSFFHALTIIRNKSSHSDVSLTENEIRKLKEGGYEVLISKTNELQLNPRNYSQIACHILNFLDNLNRR